MRKYLLMAGEKRLDQMSIQIGELSYDGAKGSFIYHLSSSTIEVLKEKGIDIENVIKMLLAIEEDAIKLDSEEACDSYIKFWINFFYFKPIESCI